MRMPLNYDNMHQEQMNGALKFTNKLLSIFKYCVLSPLNHLESLLCTYLLCISLNSIINFNMTSKIIEFPLLRLFHAFKKCIE